MTTLAHPVRPNHPAALPAAIIKPYRNRIERSGPMIRTSPGFDRFLACQGSGPTRRWAKLHPVVLR
jgi:hypothetical protein